MDMHPVRSKKERGKDFTEAGSHLSSIDRVWYPPYGVVFLPRHDLWTGSS